ncbi:phosphorylase [uncultured Alistipes sp.]|uniref:phosphorylase family protein n=1 Tax=uncultured Alistipes sp. TaxID=538949 RepID=UPI00258DC156|nr:phosphorylase [uncultured Alistipes sp.]
MKRIFIFPTIGEAKAFILTQPRDPVFVAGVGAAEIAAATIRAVKARKPQLVVLAGIAGAYDRSLQRGEVVEVVTERIAGIPERYAREYETSGPDLGLPLAAGVTVNRSGDGLRETGREQEFRETGFEIPEPETKSGDTVSAPAGQTLQPAGERADSPEQTSDMQSAIEKTSGTDGQNALPVIGDTNDTDGQSALPKIGDTNGTGGQSALPEIENMEGAAFFAVCEALGVACCQIRAVSNYVGEPFDRWAVGLAVENLTATLTQIFGNDE